jgi:hypothetical protein
MAAAPVTTATDAHPPSRLRRWTTKIASLVITGVVLGFAYDWAAPRFYHPEQRPGFWMGALHGALMPVAAPSLLMGKDVPIYAPANTGRGYKLGYIAGINGCGLLFFGLAFYQPSRRPRDPDAAISASTQ